MNHTTKILEFKSRIARLGISGAEFARHIEVSKTTLQDHIKKGDLPKLYWLALDELENRAKS